jgi:diguanylate cyclase (GGDEF)-like protein
MEPPGTDPPNPSPGDVLARQIEQCYRQLPISLAVNAVNGAILAAVLWEAIGRRTVLVWLLGLLSVTVGRAVSLRAYRDPRRQPAAGSRTWERYFVLGACANGVVWGTAGIALFHPHSFPHQVLLAFVIGGMVAGAIPLLAPLRNAYRCFAIPAVAPISVSMLTQGDRIHLIMGLMILIFGLAMLASSGQVQRLFRDTVELRLRLSSSQEASEALRQMLHMDELTGIANRRLFEESLEREWKRAQRDDAVVAVVMADIDHFKAYNDHYGHPAGDRCLVRVAQAMAGALRRPADVAARIGGEEFAFLLPETTLEGATGIAERIRGAVLALALPHATSPVAPQVTVRLGVACADPRGARSTADLLRASDDALYAAKHRGRNQVATRSAGGPGPA